jgi:Raf kinase inhibitor-like YbhB/YbcL family protein
MPSPTGRPDPYQFLAHVPSFLVQSTDLSHCGRLAWAQTAAGGHVSPHLKWSDAPDGTRSFVITCFDPDAPTPSGFWHWVLVDVPGDVRELATGIASGELPGSAFHVRNDCAIAGYYGAEPPEGDPQHRYFYVVHAVDRETLGVDADATPAMVAFELAYATLGRAVLVGSHSA